MLIYNVNNSKTDVIIYKNKRSPKDKESSSVLHQQQKLDQPLVLNQLGISIGMLIVYLLSFWKREDAEGGWVDNV